MMQAAHRRDNGAGTVRRANLRIRITSILVRSDCLNSFEAASQGPVCSECGVAVAPGTSPPMPGLPPVCGHVRCTTRAVDKLRGQQKASRLRTLHAQVGGRGEAVFTPVNQARTAPLSASRRDAFARHLAAMLDAALVGVQTSAQNRPVGVSMQGDNVHLPPETPPVVHRSIAAACANCRGWCCRTGGTNAWITSDTLRRVRLEHPDLEPATIQERYLSQLPSRAYTDSCVYHSAAGCTLDASLRSDTCHTFLCDGAIELVRLVHARSAAPRDPSVVAPHDIRIAATEGSRVVRVSRFAAR